MHRISFSIPGKPVTTNLYKAPRVIKSGRKYAATMYETKKAKDYKKTVCEYVEPFREEIDIFERQFSVHDHVLACTVILWLPDLITMDMRISKNSIDIDNSLKCLIDGVFSCFDVLDDKMICDLFVSKRRRLEPGVDITLIKQSMCNMV